MRLNKFIAQAGIASRRKADNLIESGRIKVNGKIVDQLGLEIDENKDVVECGGKTLKLSEEKIYLILNKPIGYITSNSSEQGKSVMDIVNINKRIFPVGRLDKESSGLLILTNDGDFAYKLTQAKFGHDKEYEVVLDRKLSPTDVEKFGKPMLLAGQKIQPVKVGKVSGAKVTLILREGINRQIRRMAENIGYEVLELKRVRIGKLKLGKLREGEYQRIKPSDVL